MTGFEIKAGAHIDVLTKDELDKSLDDYWTRAEAERGRGEKPMWFAGQPQASISATAGYTIVATPNEGYLWSVRNVVAGLAASGTARFYIASDTNGIPANNALIPLASGQTDTISGATFGKGSAWLRPSQYIVVSAGASATLLSYLLVVVEVPAQLAWKVS